MGKLNCVMYRGERHTLVAKGRGGWNILETPNNQKILVKRKFKKIKC